MKLYLAPYAPNPRRVAMALAEKGVTIDDTVMLDLPGGDQHSEAYRAHSPLGQVPCLVLDDGTAITESRAICLYLEGLHPEPSLFGRTPLERAQIEMWDRRTEMLLATPLMLWVRHCNPVVGAVERNQVQAVGEWNRDRAMEAARFFDRRLGETPFIVGDALTIADITALAGIDFAKMMKWRPGDDLPNLRAWRERMKDRPAGQTAP